MKIIFENTTNDASINIGAEAQSNEHQERRVNVRRFRQNKIFKPQNDDFQAQMESETSQPENQGKVIHVEKITTFTDENTSHDARDNFIDQRAYNTMPLPDLENFLERPVNLGTTTWTAAMPLGDAVGDWIFPDVFFTTTIMNKLEKIAFWQPNFEISIRMNGTPMHYGKLVFFWLPQATQLNAAYWSDYRNAFSNKFVQVSASSNQTTTISIPYTHYREFINVGKVTPDLFKLYCYVSIPLNSVNGVPPSVNFTLYGRVVKPKLLGFNYTTDFVAQMSSPDTQSDVESISKTSGSKVISNSIYSLADTISKFHWLPTIGTFAGTASKIASRFGDMAKYLGFSVPINVSTTVPMQVRQPRMLQIEDCPTSLNLGPVASQSVSKDYALVNDLPAAESILKFSQRPGILYTGTITGLEVSGTKLWSQWVTPNDGYAYDYITPYDSNGAYPTPVTWVNKFFDKWRGGLRFHISFTCSHFHSLRVAIWYMPYVPGATFVAPSPTEVEIADMINVTLDITKETDYSFTIPYCQQSEWLNHYTSHGPPWYANGLIGISLINPVTSGAATVSPVYYQIFMSAAEDIQFAAPTSGHLASAGIYYPINDPEFAEATDNDSVHFEAQSEFSVSECELSSLSSDCLTTKDYPPLGGTAIGRTNHGVYQGVEITSLKQLSNMLCPIKVFTPGSTSTTLPSGYDICTTADSGYYTSDGRWANLMLNMTTVFRYFRGGYRLSIRSLDQSSQAYFRAKLDNGTFTDLFTAIGAIDPHALTNTSMANYCAANAGFVNLVHNPVDITVPYYNIYKCYPTRNEGGTDYDPFYNLMGSMLVLSPNNKSILIFMGGADDFILGFQLGIPLQSTDLPG